MQTGASVPSEECEDAFASVKRHDSYLPALSALKWCQSHRHLWTRRSRSQRAERHGLTIACTLTEPDEQNEMIVSSVSSVLLQSTATTRNSLTTIATVSTGRTSLRAFKSGRLRRFEPDIVVHPPQSEVDGETPQLFPSSHHASRSWRARRLHFHIFSSFFWFSSFFSFFHLFCFFFFLLFVVFPFFRFICFSIFHFFISVFFFFSFTSHPSRRQNPQKIVQKFLL